MMCVFTDQKLYTMLTERWSWCVVLILLSQSVRVSAVLRKLFVVFNNLSGSHHQVVETSVNVTTNSPSQDYTYPGDHTTPTNDMTSS